MIIRQEIVRRVTDYIGRSICGTFIFFGDSKKLKLILIDKVAESFSNIERVDLIDEDFIPIDKVRYLLSFVRLKSQGLKFAIIDVDNLNIYSVNAMLKTLEEPPEGCFFFLFKEDSNILPTILSRSIRIHVNPNTSNLLDYLVKTYYYPINWAEFVILFTNANFDLIEYFSMSFWNLKERKPKDEFKKILDFFMDPSRDMAFNDEFWVNNFSCFISFKLLLKLIKSLIRDIYMVNLYRSVIDENVLKMLERSFIYSKILGKEEFINKFLRYNLKYENIHSLFKEVRSIDSGMVFKRINKKILYTCFMFKVYHFLRSIMR